MKKESIKEFLGNLLFIVAVAFLTWAFLMLTPPQESAECEALRIEMQEKGLID